MGQPGVEAAVARITAISEYQWALRRVFGRPLNRPDLFLIPRAEAQPVDLASAWSGDRLG
jgi:hypothetical protein